MSAVLFALAAIVLWSTLALAGSGLKDIPPLLVLGAAFCTSGLAAGLLVLARKGKGQDWHIPWPTLLVGVGGIFGYHFLYFRAFALAPAVEVNLINYLWPLLIVALSPLVLPGYTLKPRHVLGVLLGLAGAALIATGGKLSLETRYLPGYLLALGAAVIWALYSLLTKRLPYFPTVAVGLFCLVSGVLSLVVYFLNPGGFQNAAQVPPRQWLALVLAGLGPMGAAFFLWDGALKRGDPRVIGSLAYLTPLLSTLNLILIDRQRLTVLSVAAMVLIVLGAVVGSWAKPNGSHPQPAVQPDHPGN